jgi:hypothetical protein
VAEVASTAETVAKPFFDQAVWGSVPTLLWVLFLTAFLWHFRADIHSLVGALVSRLKGGAAVKLAGFEIGATSGLVAAPGDFSNEDSRVGVYVDQSGSREKERAGLYAQSKGVMLVHRLQRSRSENHLYDILIYVIPHKSCSLASVTQIEYFFGHHWGNKVYPSSDRSRGFPIVTSAYGPFLCTAKVHFNDGTTVTLSRYVDFEMGSLAQQNGSSLNG